MDTSAFNMLASNTVSMMKDSYDYFWDATQRSVLMGDIIRKRGNTYLSHLKKGQPPILAFDYQTLCDGRTLDRPVNYQLVRIFDRRMQLAGKRENGEPERREEPDYKFNASKNPKKRPIVVMDPRAGHGPGIGGSKMDSQIGTAMSYGHTVYFMVFSTDPIPGQTVADVQKCQIHFLEQVALRHPEAQKPAIIGNCQAGWAAALIAADRPDVTGPLVLNGSPISYWGGVKGTNPMRYRGGLFGGNWLASLCSDLGNGKFDGAHLVAGFEELNAANTFWTKLYNVYSKVDTEEKRFLDFEKWWGGFFMLSREEIGFITNNLFISDELEQGYLKLGPDSFINLKNFKDPIVIFASKGDNITPPQQALNWITSVYKDVEEIKKCGQVIVYLLHDSIGHLGIFVSSKVNRKEHKEIIGCVDAIDFLIPGLYEMTIDEEPSEPWPGDQIVRFQKRTMADILKLDDGTEDEEAFQPVSSVSKFNDKVYRDMVSPWVRLWSNDLTAEWIRQTHPLRTQRYGFSDMNPFMIPFKPLAGMVQQARKPVEPDNLFLNAEKTVSDLIINGFNLYQKSRDALFEAMFYTMYGNDWVKTLFYSDDKKEKNPVEEPDKTEMFTELETQLWLSAMKKGGFKEAVIRIILSVTSANHIINMAEYDAAKFSMKSDNRLKEITPDQLKALIRDQAALLEKDRDLSLDTLPDLIPEKKDRKAALEIARILTGIEAIKKFKKTVVFKKIETILFPDEPPFEFSS